MAIEPMKFINAIHDSRLDKAHKAVLIAMVTCTDNVTGMIRNCPTEEFARQSGYTRQTVSMVLPTLAKGGLRMETVTSSNGRPIYVYDMNDIYLRVTAAAERYRAARKLAKWVDRDVKPVDGSGADVKPFDIKPSSGLTRDVKPLYTFYSSLPLSTEAGTAIGETGLQKAEREQRERDSFSAYLKGMDKTDTQLNRTGLT